MSSNFPINIWGIKQETMDVTGSLRKIAKELSELRYHSDDLETQLKGASWLITYIADCLDVELQHAVNRGKEQAKNQLPPGPNGVKDYTILSGEDI